MTLLSLINGKKIMKLTRNIIRVPKKKISLTILVFNIWVFSFLMLVVFVFFSTDAQTLQAQEQQKTDRNNSQNARQEIEQPNMMENITEENNQTEDEKNNEAKNEEVGEESQQEKIFIEDTPPDFRGVYWGAKQEEVLEKELLTLREKNYDRLVYQADYLGYQTIVYYLFANNQLTNGQIVFPSGFSYPVSRKKLFLEIRSRLLQQLGKPMLDETSQLSKENSSQEEVSNENFTYRVVWNTQTSFVTLKLWRTKKNPKTYLAIFYTQNP